MRVFFIENATKQRRNFYLLISLVSNISILAFFKYYSFISTNLSVLLNEVGYENHFYSLDIALPIGLSFHTFQAMSYTIEVFRGNQKAERNFGMYSLYILFYPQLTAGPIERPQNLLHQFYEKHTFEYERIVDGLKLMLWGFFMKIVIADRLALYVNAVYETESQHYGKSFALATVFFSFQIYCDFAGYSNIAIGAAKVMGFKLMTNFNRPYFSKSISEFWKRWHISLSTWFKDYVYIPMGGNRVSVPRMYFNLLFVFMVSGFWHGANWTFIAWGLLNGIYLVIEKTFGKVYQKASKLLFPGQLQGIKNALKTLVTFILISFAWIFFRADSIHAAINIVRKIVAFEGPFFLDKTQIMYGVSAILFLLGVEFFQGKRRYKSHLPFACNHWLKENIAYAFLCILILLLGIFTGQEFIYFQF